MLELDKIYNMDCIDGMKQLEENSIDLIIADPPYNIGKADWDKIDNYIEWSGKWIGQCERILKDNGSFYFFHNDILQIAQLIEWLRINSKFVFKQFIVWNKRFNGAKNKGYLDGFVEVNGIRNYQQMAEYILFYTFQDELQEITSFDNLREYIKKEGKKAFNDINKMNVFLGFCEKGGMATRKYLGKTQWYLPTEEHYEKLQTTGFFQKSYKDISQEYKNLRYTFNNQKTHHSVWNYEIAKKEGHITSKPIKLLENIIKHSSNENDIIIDPFLGSGSVALACKQLNRHFIGFEINKEYYTISLQRLLNISKRLDYFMEVKT